MRSHKTARALASYVPLQPLAAPGDADSARGIAVAANAPVSGGRGHRGRCASTRTPPPPPPPRALQRDDDDNEYVDDSARVAAAIDVRLVDGRYVHIARDGRVVRVE